MALIRCMGGAGAITPVFTNIGSGTPTSAITAKMVIAMAGAGNSSPSITVTSGTYSSRNNLANIGSTNWGGVCSVFFDAEDLVLTGVNQLSVATIDW